MIQPDRTQAPPFQLSSDYSLTQPEAFSLSGGQPVYAFRDIEQNVVKLDLVFEAGKWYESDLGVSYFASHLLPKGTSKRNSFQIAEALDMLGAHLEVSAGYDTTTLSLFVLRKNFFASLIIVIDLLQTPTFDENELRQEKEIFLQELRVNNEKTNVLASKEIRKAIFGENHPYGSSAEEPDVLAIQRETLLLFFRNHFHLQSAYLIGRLSDEEIRKMLEVLAQPPSPRLVESTFSPQRGISHRVEKPGSVQSSIRLGRKCIQKSNRKEYFDAVVFNHVLGGFFGSRLMKNIREEKGLTYGIYSSMNHFLRESYWVISADVNQQNVQEAIREIRHEIKTLQEVPMPITELDIARNYFIGSWQSDNSTLFAVADKIRNIHSFGLTDDYYQYLLEHVRLITPFQIQAIANSHFDAADLIEIQVGG